MLVILRAPHVVGSCVATTMSWVLALSVAVSTLVSWVDELPMCPTVTPLYLSCVFYSVRAGWWKLDWWLGCNLRLGGLGVVPEDSELRHGCWLLARS